MNVDISQFRDTFLEECLEGLDFVETTLIAQECLHLTKDHIDGIFRAIHSIKGGSSTFGYCSITPLTHTLETYLDTIRHEEKKLDDKGIDIILKAVDTLRSIFKQPADDLIIDMNAVNALQKELEEFVGNLPENVECTIASEQNDPFSIIFEPHPDLFLSGNDPYRIIKALGELGNLTGEVNVSGIPSFEELDPEKCYLSWTFELSSENVTESAIHDVFDWIDDQCNLEIDILVSNENTTISSTQTTKTNESPSPVKTSSSSPTAKENSSIRVGIDKVDHLLNLVGELVITQSMLSQMATDFHNSNIEQLLEGVTLLEQNTRELQESVMNIRMVPISFIFDRVPRLVYDLSSSLNKKINLDVSGKETEIDKTVLENLSDPLIHLVRNSLDHGIETPEERVKNGKSETGTLKLHAHHQSGNIIIEISDDGAGLNQDKILQKAISKGIVQEDEELSQSALNELIFNPGFSTADEVSDISGRGVGMDVVNKNIQSLGGRVDIETEQGVGTTFIIQLPLTLAILDGQLLKIGNSTYILPLVSIIESVKVTSDKIDSISGQNEVYRLRDEYIPIIRVYEVLEIENAQTNIYESILVIVESRGQKIGLVVDELQAQQQVVIKSLEDNYKKVPIISGATILGNGKISLILDVAGFIALTNQDEKAA